MWMCQSFVTVIVDAKCAFVAYHHAVLIVNTTRVPNVRMNKHNAEVFVQARHSCFFSEV